MAEASNKIGGIVSTVMIVIAIIASSIGLGEFMSRELQHSISFQSSINQNFLHEVNRVEAQLRDRINGIEEEQHKQDNTPKVYADRLRLEIDGLHERLGMHLVKSGKDYVRVESMTINVENQLSSLKELLEIKIRHLECNSMPKGAHLQ